VSATNAAYYLLFSLRCLTIGITLLLTASCKFQYNQWKADG